MAKPKVESSFYYSMSLKSAVKIIIIIHQHVVLVLFYWILSLRRLAFLMLT